MLRWLYTLFFYLSLPVVLARLWWRGFKAPDYRKRVPERFGVLPFKPLKNCLWVHTVSVGETIAAEPIIRALLKHPSKRPVVVTTMTPTGSAHVKALFGDSVLHVYAPYDIPFAVKRFLGHCKPDLLLIYETELWPNTIHFSAQAGIPVVLANARLSESSARGYSRLGSLSRSMIGQLSMIAVQTEIEAQRFLQLGAEKDSVVVTGSVKYDVVVKPELAEQAEHTKMGLRGAGSRLIWIAASTHAGEDELVLDAYQEIIKTFPDLLLILVPRHPERFKSVGQLVVNRGCSLVCRSTEGRVTQDTQVLLVDTMGELLMLLGVADVAFVGGSLAPNGGHNLLEPVVWGLPVVAGPHLFNFLEVSQKLKEAEALTIVRDAAELTATVLTWCSDPVARMQAGEAGYKVLAANRGATDRLMTLVQGQIRPI